MAMIPAWGISLIIAGGGMGLQYLLSPRPKTQPTDKGKMDDIRITGSDYGTYIPRAKGKVRLPGTIFFSDGITHTIQNTPTGGGKGVPQAPATRTHVYTSSIGVLIARGEVNNFYRTWADADLILGNGEVQSGTFEAEDATLGGGATTAIDTNASGGEYVTSLGSGGTATFDFSGIADPPYPNIDDPDEIATAYTRISFFYKCAADRQAVIDTDTAADITADFPATGTDWTTKTVFVPGFVDTLIFKNAGATAPDLDVVTIEKYWEITILDNPTAYKTPAYQVTGAINQNIIYPLDSDDPGEYYNAALTDDGTGKIALSVPLADTRYYKGTTTQTQDAAMISWLDAKYGAGEGVQRTPAHLGYAYVMFENRVLRQARTENFRFELDFGGATVNDVLEMMFADLGITDYDVTATAGLSFIGWIEHTRTTVRKQIEDLEKYFFFRIAEIDGEIVTILDTATSAGTIDADLLRAHDYGESMPLFDGEIAIRDVTSIPRQIAVSVMNPDIEYNNEAVPASLFGSMNAVETAEVAFPIVDKASTARNVAERMLLKAHNEERAVEFYGMPEMAEWAVGDVVTVPFNGTEVKVRIEKKQKTLPIGKIRFQGISVSPFSPTYYQDDFTVQAHVRRSQLATFNFPRNSVVIPIISEPLTANERGKLGVYLAVCGRGRGASENIAVFREFDTDNFVQQFIVDVQARAGLCAGTLGNHGGGTGTEDTTNTLDIWFFNDVELETVTQPDLDRFPTLNLIRIGDEWVQFRTATAQTLEEDSPYRSKWRISNLWRGRFGTSAEISAHAADEYASIYDEGMVFFELGAEDIGETVTFKAVTNGQAVENGLTTTFTFNPVYSYTVTNETDTRTLDANATSLNELADVVATILKDKNLAS